MFNAAAPTHRQQSTHGDDDSCDVSECIVDALWMLHALAQGHVVADDAH